MNNVLSSFLKSIVPLASAGFALASALPSFAAGGPPPETPTPKLTISVPADINLGDTATVIVNAKHPDTDENIVGLPIVSIRVDYPSVDPDTQLPIVLSIQLVELNSQMTDGSGNVTVQFDPQALGIPANCGNMIRAQSSQVSPQVFQGTHTVSLQFCINEVSCGAPFTFALTDVSGPGELLVSTKNVKYHGDWDLTYTVKACTDIVAGTKVQGGVVAWATYEGVTASAGQVTVSTKNKNSIITWILPAMASGDEHTITVHISGNSSTVIGTQPLSGAWSAVYQTLEEANNIDPITQLPAPIPAHKSDYTPRATYEVVSVLSP